MRLLAIITITFIAAACGVDQQSADLIIFGKIYTGNEKQPVVEAVAVQGDTILFAGSKNDASKFLYDKTKVIKLRGSVMTPGFIEGHAHMIEVGYNEMNLNFQNIKSYEEMVKLVAEAVQRAKPGEWILGRGWHQDKWESMPEKMVKGFQTHELLSAVSPDNPVLLEHASGHTAIANAKAMQLAGMNPLSLEKINRELEGDGGEVLLDDLGNPTGIFSENAMDLIKDKIPKNDMDRDAKALELALQACLRNGYTSFHDAETNRSSLEVFYKFRNEGKLSVRLYAMLSSKDKDLIREWFKRGPDIDKENRLTVRAVKVYGDGALGSRGAWLLEPYSDRPDHYGMATVSMDSVLQIARVGLKSGFQVCTHAIGDRANREILDIYEQALMERGSAPNPRFRIEHAQHLHPDDIKRFGKLGVIPALQAIHMSSDRPWAIDRLGEKRIREGAYMWQSLLKSGAFIVNGTDAPVEPLNPIPSFYASITRKTLQGTPEGGYEPNEKMTREQALRSFTLDAAYGAFEENVKGTIEEGKLADFTVFSRDIMTVHEDSVLSTSVVMTIVGGQISYEKK